MMFGHDFYHGTLRRFVIMFGNLFNEIQIERYDANGNVAQTLNVPIEYGPKQKFYQRIYGDPTLNREIAVTNPRLGFEFISMNYAPSRKINTAHKFVKGQNTGGNDFNFTYAPVPYDMQFQLNAFVKNAEDGTQIVEQIVPFFTPDWTVTMKVLPELGVNMDIPIELTSVSSTDEWEGDFDTRRVLTWQFDFTVKGYLFGPLQKYKYIDRADVHTNIESATITTQTFEGDAAFQITETVTENNHLL